MSDGMPDGKEILLRQIAYLQNDIDQKNRLLNEKDNLIEELRRQLNIFY